MVADWCALAMVLAQFEMGAEIAFTGRWPRWPVQHNPHDFIGQTRPTVSLKATALVEFHNLAKWLDSTSKRHAPPVRRFDR
jgi:hypothetical protein